MELTKNIFFNTDKLVENSKVKISYTGELFQNASTDVSIHYGFGANWDNVGDAKMEKTELGFQIEVELIRFLLQTCNFFEQSLFICIILSFYSRHTTSKKQNSQ